MYSSSNDYSIFLVLEFCQEKMHKECQSQIQREALDLLDEALQYELEFDTLPRAIELCHQSVSLWPHPLIYTHLSWLYHSQWKIQESILVCQEAIRTHPDFGNAYNDIGSCLMNEGDLEQAELMFMTAIQKQK